MSTALQVQPDEITRQMMEVESTQKMCASLMKTPHYAKMGNDGIFAIVSKARALDMNTMDALNGSLYYVNGKVGMPAETMSSLIRQKGHSIVKDAKSNDTVCILHGKRADNGDTWTISFSVEDARRAGLLKNMYEKYPSAMLYNRAMSFLARQLFPDVIKGAGYTMDELREIASNTATIVPLQPVEEPKKEFVTVEQAKELSQILNQCEESYVKQVHAALNISNLEDVPSHLFERIKNAALKKKAEFVASMTGEDAEYIEAELINA